MENLIKRKDQIEALIQELHVKYVDFETQLQQELSVNINKILQPKIPIHVNLHHEQIVFSTTEAIQNEREYLYSDFGSKVTLYIRDDKSFEMNYASLSLSFKTDKREYLTTKF